MRKVGYLELFAKSVRRAADIFHIHREKKLGEIVAGMEHFISRRDQAIGEFTNLSVQQVMERVGFLDAAYFSKVFKKALGYSPRNFREIISKKK